MLLVYPAVTHISIAVAAFKKTAGFTPPVLSEYLSDKEHKWNVNFLLFGIIYVLPDLVLFFT